MSGPKHIDIQFSNRNREYRYILQVRREVADDQFQMHIIIEIAS